jgi:hypothetical protein
MITTFSVLVNFKSDLYLKNIFQLATLLFVADNFIESYLAVYDSKICPSEYRTPWRNGSASDSRSEGCVFKSRRGQNTFLDRMVLNPCTAYNIDHTLPPNIVNHNIYFHNFLPVIAACF